MTRILLICFALILSFVVFCEPHAFAEGWSPSTGVALEATHEKVLIPQHLNGPALKTTRHVSLQYGKPWSIAFEVKLGSIVGSMSVCLLKGGDRVGWMGADDYYKAESAFLGKDIPSIRPTDTEWHKYEYRSDGQRLALYCDDQKVDEISSTAAPDAIQVSSNKLEVTLREIVVKTATQVDVSPAVKSNILVDYFDNPTSFPAKWIESDNTGHISFTVNGISLISSGNGLPSIQLKTNPFTSAEWTVSFGYRYSSIGNYGSELACLGAKDGANLFCVHQDVNGQFVQINGKSVYHESANTNWHVLNLAKEGSVFDAYLDGRQIGESKVSNIPTTIRIGGGYETGKWNWSDIDLQFVRVCNGIRVFDKTALNIAPVTSVAETSTSVGVAYPIDNIKPDLEKNTEDALAKSEVNIKIYNLIDGFDTWTSFDIAVTNFSDKPIEFWTKPVVIFADGSVGPVQSVVASTNPIQSIQSMVSQGLSMASPGSPRSSYVGKINGFVPTCLEDTMIPPGKRLFFRCGTYLGNASSLPVKFFFRSGAYNGYSIQYHVLGTTDFP